MLIGNTISLLHPIWIGVLGMIPTGGVVPFFGAVGDIPTGWLPLDGSAISRTTYAALFDLLGTTYGPGDGSTTFNLPDARGKGLIFVNDITLPNGADGAFTTRALADTGGEEEHQLTTAEMPSHNHGTNARGSGLPGVGPQNAADQTSIVGASIDPTGGDQAHNNMQPFLVSNLIIKT